MIVKKFAIFMSLASLLLSGCGIRITPNTPSSESIDPASTWSQPEEHGDGNYNYDELEFADVEKIIADYWSEHYDEGARWNNVRGFSDLDVYFYNRETGVRKDRSISYPFNEKTPFGPFDLRAVAYFNGQYYKLEIDLNNTLDKAKGYFKVTFDNDDKGTMNNKKGYYGMSQIGYDGDYHFVIEPNNKYLKNGRYQFEFTASVNHDNFKISVQDVSVFEPCVMSYSGMSSSGNVRYYYAPVVDEVIGEYSLCGYGTLLPIGRYAMKGVANLNGVVHETAPQFFNVCPLTFDGCEYEANHEFTYNGVHLYDYQIKTAVTKNGYTINNVKINWVNASRVIDMTTAKDGVVSFNEQVIFSGEYYADFLTDVHVRILINGFAHVAIADTVYNGEEQQPKMSNFVEELMVIDEDSVIKATNAGEYQATVRFKKGIQGKFADGATESVATWHINKANPETFYNINNLDSYYELELEDENGNIVSAGRKDNYNNSFSIPAEAVGKRAYIRLYRLTGQNRKLVETDGILVTTTGELAAYGYDYEKGAIYFDCDAYGFRFNATVQLGAQEETNFEPFDIPFNCYVAAPYEHELVLDKDHRHAANVHSICPDGGLGGDGDDFYFKASVHDHKSSNMLIAKTFDTISEIRIEYQKTDVLCTNGGVSVYLGNDVEQIKTARFEMYAFDSDITALHTSMPRHDYETTVIINDVGTFTRLDGPLYVKMAISGQYNGGGSHFCYIKSITIRYTGQMIDLDD